MLEEGEEKQAEIASSARVRSGTKWDVGDGR